MDFHKVMSEGVINFQVFLNWLQLHVSRHELDCAGGMLVVVEFGKSAELLKVFAKASVC